MSRQLCLKWNDHTNLINEFKTLLIREEMVDVTLACDGQSIKAHKIVLSAGSPYLKSLLLENPCKHPIVILKDMGFTDIKLILEYLYCGQVNVALDEITALVKAAETLKIKGLGTVLLSENKSNDLENTNCDLSENPSGDESENPFGDVLENQSADESPHPSVYRPDFSNNDMQKRSMSDVNIGEVGVEIKTEKLSDDIDINSNDQTVPLQVHTRSSVNDSQEEHLVGQNVDNTFAHEKFISMIKTDNMELPVNLNNLSAMSKSASTLETNETEEFECDDNYFANESQNYHGDVSENESLHQSSYNSDFSNGAMQKHIMNDEIDDGIIEVEVKEELSGGMATNVPDSTNPTVSSQVRTANSIHKSQEEPLVEQTNGIACRKKRVMSRTNRLKKESCQPSVQSYNELHQNPTCSASTSALHAASTSSYQPFMQSSMKLCQNSVSSIPGSVPSSTSSYQSSVQLSLSDLCKDSIPSSSNSVLNPATHATSTSFCQSFEQFNMELSLNPTPSASSSITDDAKQAASTSKNVGSPKVKILTDFSPRVVVKKLEKIPGMSVHLYDLENKQDRNNHRACKSKNKASGTPNDGELKLKVYKCRGCSFKSVSIKSLERHLKNKQHSARFKCDQCTYVATKKQYVVKHKTRVHQNDRSYQCNVCSCKFANQYNLKRHFGNIHRNRSSYKCDQCTYVATKKQYVESHKAAVHDHDRPYQCNVCPNRYIKQSYLKRHIENVHGNLKRFKCDKCTYASYEKYNVARHRATMHQNNRPYQCSKCLYKFIKKFHLQRHIAEVHGNVKRYKCQECDYSASDKSAVDKHSNAIHNTKKQ